MTDFEQYRRADRSINLLNLWQETTKIKPRNALRTHRKAEHFFANIELYQAIHSRQVAALAVATFNHLSYLTRKNPNEARPDGS